jgi:hypothetical protein
MVFVETPHFSKWSDEFLRGKRGGARVIYFHVASDDQVYLLYGYAKNKQADLTKAQLSYLAALMREELDG